MRQMSHLWTTLVEVAVAEARPSSDKYETVSEDDFSDREEEDIAPISF